VRRDLVQPETLDVLIADQARAVRPRRRLHALMMASAQNCLNKPEILVKPVRNDGTIQAWFLSPAGPVVDPRPAGPGRRQTTGLGQGRQSQGGQVSGRKALACGNAIPWVRPPSSRRPA
jgi:hypothetical protein